MTFWSVFFGVLAGIFAGIGINIGIDFVRKCIVKEKIIKNLKFEINFNIKKINSFLEELDRYRDKVTGDFLSSYFGYFNLSKVIVSTLVQMFFTGAIYNNLDSEDIGKLQNFSSDFSLGTEQYMNNQITWNRTNIKKSPNVKQIAMGDIEYWRSKFNKNIKNLQSIKVKL